MSSRAREFAKFFAGVAAQETIGHWWLGLWGRDLLPMKFAWFTFTPMLNTFAMVLWPLLLVALVYYAWLCRDRTRSPSGGPTAVA